MNSTTARSGAAWLLEPLGTVLDADGAGWWYLWRVAVPTLVVSYLSLVRLLRYRAARRIQTKYAAFAADPYKLDYKQAREIMRGVFLYDMPFLFGFGTQWALIKSFGIASGTPLLVATRQLSDPARVGRRAEDTAVFVTEMLVGDIDSARGRTALARLNWLHGRYRISNGDYVHTLSLFVLEPQRWIARFGWRPLSRLEQAAILVYWRELGHRMGFGGIPETVEALREWKRAYEDKHLYFIEANRTVTEATLALFLLDTPRPLHGFMRSLFVAFIDEAPVRRALGLPDPPRWAIVLTTSIFEIQRFVSRHLLLPRLRMRDPLAKEDKHGRFHRGVDYFAFEPWYVADTWYNRFRTWRRTGGKAVAGEKYQSEGYKQEELGPPGTQNQGLDKVREQAELMQDYIRRGGSAGVGCPFGHAPGPLDEK